MTKQQWAYEWPRPAVTVDVVLFSVAGTAPDLRLRVLLVRRGLEPFLDRWALPGGYVRENEDLPDAARRELAEETGVRDVFLEQVTAVGTPGRDPRGHTITVVYAALVAADRHRLEATGDASAAHWFDVTGPEPLPLLSFDHAELLRRALDHLRVRLAEAPVCFGLLPTTFSLGDLQAVCEAILGRPVDRRNFRRKVRELGFLEPAGARREGRHRPAQLYRFVPEQFERYTQRGTSLPF